MTFRHIQVPLVALCLYTGWMVQAAERPSVVLEGSAATLVVDLNGGSVAEFRFKDSALNPLTWATPQPSDASIHAFGHFLCLDRWGPPSEAEAARGMPYHGEASHVTWQVTRPAAPVPSAIEAEMTAALPLAGLHVRRTIRLSNRAAVFTVEEEVTNRNPLGRIYNMVQHPTVGPPFLDEGTLVDCNGHRGFAQGGTLPNPEEPSSVWAQVVGAGGKPVDLRRLTSDPNPNVVSYVIDEPLGWITAANPKRGLLIGYLWPTIDYPWVSLWRDVQNGRPSARGLEFGTTGLHQPFPILVAKGRIWDRPLFAYLDAGETRKRAYIGFLLRIPSGFAGVGSIGVREQTLIIRERDRPSPREWQIAAPAIPSLGAK